MSLLTDKVALVTGAGSGIGKAIAEKYASHGAHVVVADINIDSADTVANSLAEQYGKEAIAIQMDVSSPDAITQGVSQIISKFNRVDVLVSNAGIQIISPITEFKFEDWRRMQAIVVDGGFLLSQACMREMQRTGGGSIIFMGSIHSVMASPEKSAYVAAKHALMGLMRAIAIEGAEHNIRANLIGPGFVETPLVDKQIPEQAKALGISKEEVINRVMLGQTVDHTFTSLDDVAEVALFLAGFPTNALTGQSLIVSHGWHMQ